MSIKDNIFKNESPWGKSPGSGGTGNGSGRRTAPPTIDERVAACKQHLQRSLDWKGPILGVVETRRHYTNYFKGMFGIKEFRTKLVTTDDPETLFELLDEIAEHFAGYSFS